MINSIMSDTDVKSSEEIRSKETETAEIKTEVTPILEEVTSDSWQEDGPRVQESATVAPVIKEPVAAPSVTLDRKKELLLQARANRLAWIQSVPLPYENATVDVSSPSDRVNADYLSSLQSTHAIHKLPSLSKVLSTLYGADDNGLSTPEDNSDRIQRVLDSLGISQADRDLAIRTGNQAMEEELSTTTADGQLDLLRHYREFVTRLELPECASLVQGMRNFVFKLSAETADNLASSLRTYTESTFEVIKTHPAWTESGLDDPVRQAFESFMYGQCRDKIAAQLVAEKQQDNEILERFASLHFLTPSHLEIACLSDDEDIGRLLSEPVEALNSMTRFHSPYAKLQRILKVYHGINSALKVALNRGNESASTLPSADDVLPTLILTVIHARPSHLISNLRMIEVFAAPEYLRGEAGYAFTNLYSAVQFIRDLKMDNPDTLAIDADDFRKGMEEYRSACEKVIRPLQY